MPDVRTAAGETILPSGKPASFSYGREYEFKLGRELGVPNELAFSRFLGLDIPVKGKLDIVPSFRSRLLDLSVKATANDRIKAGLNVGFGYDLGSAKVSAEGSLGIGYTGQQLTITGSPLSGSFESTAPRAYIKVDPEISFTLNPGISYDIDPIGRKRWKGQKRFPINIPDAIPPLVDLDTTLGTDQKTSVSANGLNYSASLPNAELFDLSGGSIDPLKGSISASFEASAPLFDASFDVAKLSPIPLSAEARFGGKYFAAGGKITGLEGNLGAALDLILRGSASADIEFDLIMEGGVSVSFEPGQPLSINDIKDANGDGYLSGSINGSVDLGLSATAGLVPSLTAGLKALGASGFLSFEGITVLGKKIKGKKISGGISPRTFSKSFPTDQINLFEPISRTISYDLASQPFFVDLASSNVLLGQIPV
jgi:hypothetical protein